MLMPAHITYTITLLPLVYVFKEWKFTLQFLNSIREPRRFPLSHNSPCFQSNMAITNFLVSHTCKIRFQDVIGQSTVPIDSYAKIPKRG